MKVAELVALVSFESDDSAEDVDNEINDVKEGLRSVKNVALAAVGALAAVTGAALEFTRRTAQQADELIKTADAFDLTVDRVQRLQIASDAATKSGIAVDRMLRRVRTSAESAADGTGAAADSYGRLGLNAQRIMNMDADESLLEIADAFGEMDDKNRALNEAVNIFGSRMGEEMVPFLMEGREGLEAMGDRAEELGVIFDQETARQAEELNDELMFLGLAIRGMVQPIALELIPALREMIGSFQDLRQEHQDLIDEGIEVTIDIITFSLRAFMWTMDTTIELTATFLEALGGLRNTLQMLGVAIVSLSLAWAMLNTQILFSAFTAIVAWGKAAIAAAASWIVAMGPVILLGAALAGIFLLVEDFLGETEGAGSLIQEIFGESESAILKAATAIGAIIVGIIVLIGLVIGWPVALAVALATLVGLVIAQWDTIKQATLDFLSFLWDGITDTFNRVVEWLSDLGSRMWSPVQSGFESMMDTIESIFDSIMSGIEERIDQVTGAVDSVVDGAKGAVNTLPGVQISSPNREDGFLSAIMGSENVEGEVDHMHQAMEGTQMVQAVLGGGAMSPTFDAQAQQARERRMQPQQTSPVNIEANIDIDATEMSPEELAEAVEDGLVSASDVLKAMQDFRGHPE